MNFVNNQLQGPVYKVGVDTFRQGWNARPGCMLNLSLSWLRSDFHLRFALENITRIRHEVLLHLELPQKYTFFYCISVVASKVKTTKLRGRKWADKSEKLKKPNKPLNHKGFDLVHFQSETKI